MTNFSNKPQANPLAVFALTAASFLPLSASAQEGPPKSEKLTGLPTTPLNDTLNTSGLKLPTNKARVDLPQRVLDKAAEKGISPAKIKLDQGKWVMCTDKSCTVLLEATEEEIQGYNKPEAIKGLRTGELLSITGHTYSTHRVEAENSYGIPGLGSFTTAADGTKTFTPDEKFKGTVTRSDTGTSSDKATTTKTDSAKVVEVSYSTEELEKIHNRLMLELDTTFVFVISVPSRCIPCRTYKQELNKAAAHYSADNKRVAFVTINFDSFEQAQKIMGAVTGFPTTIVMPAIKSDKFTYKVDPDWTTKPFLQAINRPGYQVEGAKQNGPLREIVSSTLNVTEKSLRGVTRSLRELLDGVGK